MLNLCVFNPVESMGHVVHSGASRVRNVDNYFSYSAVLDAFSTKSASGHITSNLFFCIW
jgi:hypothetical protein